jgi:Tfp pilus assembly protein PilO
MKSSNRLILSILGVAVLAIAFWMLALGPKREEADKLGGQVEQLHLALSEAESKAAQAAAARREFPADYRHLVVLGQAVPGNDETSSLLVELNRVAARSHVKFDSIQLNGSGESSTEAAPVAPAAPETSPAAPAAGSSSGVPAAATVPPTEAAASAMPLGATVGPAGLAVMPYDLTFGGNFFQIADFIKELDSLVHTGGPAVTVDGRLVTLDSFALTADASLGFPHLNATFSVTTYLTPPAQGVTAGASPTAPATAVAAPAAEETAAAAPAPEEAAAPEAAPEASSEPVSTASTPR